MTRATLYAICVNIQSDQSETHCHCKQKNIEHTTQSFNVNLKKQREFQRSLQLLLWRNWVGIHSLKTRTCVPYFSLLNHSTLQKQSGDTWKKGKMARTCDALTSITVSVLRILTPPFDHVCRANYFIGKNICSGFCLKCNYRCTDMHL